MTELDDLEDALSDALAYVSIHCAIRRFGVSEAFPPFDPFAHVLLRAGMLANNACSQRLARREMEE